MPGQIELVGGPLDGWQLEFKRYPSTKILVPAPGWTVDVYRMSNVQTRLDCVPPVVRFEYDAKSSRGSGCF